MKKLNFGTASGGTPRNRNALRAALPHILSPLFYPKSAPFAMTVCCGGPAAMIK